MTVAGLSSVGDDASLVENPHGKGHVAGGQMRAAEAAASQKWWGESWQLTVTLCG